MRQKGGGFDSAVNVMQLGISVEIAPILDKGAIIFDNPTAMNMRSGLRDMMADVF